jgi:hypothetical protein
LIILLLPDRLAKNEIGSPEMKGPGRGKEREV